MAEHKHGCCSDKACNESTCMELPTGKTCGHCVHERRCCTMFGHTPTDTYCDWFPRRFRERETPAGVETPRKITSVAEFCAEAERIGLTAADLAEALSKRPEFADCLPTAGVASLGGPSNE